MHCIGILIPKVVGSIPTVVRHIFQACPVWIYTQSTVTSQASYSPEYITPSEHRKNNKDIRLAREAGLEVAPWPD
jgi:hypothetical protein